MSCIPSGYDGNVNVIRIGSRSSELAMIQTRTIMAALKTLHPNLTFEVVTMKTIGDKILDTALPKIGQTNLFTKELETALAAKKIDMITHSLKDLPTTLPPGMGIAVIYKRDNPTDALVLHPKHKGLQIETLPDGSIVGTSSLRRVAQLKRNFPGLKFESVRGNLNTRLKKLDEGSGGVAYDALVLATAGLERMGWGERLSQELDKSACMYAVGQGALAVETRVEDTMINNLLSPLNDADTYVSCSAERAFLHTLEGGCSVPVGINSTIDTATQCLTIEGAVFSLDGSERVGNVESLSLPENYHKLSLAELGEMAVRVGDGLARKLLAQGAGKILEQAKEESAK
jgi:hydroxymethylbilane synthase